MEVTIFLIILAISCQNVIAAQKKLQRDRLIFDLTKPVNELMDGRISETVFISNINSAYRLIGDNITNSTIFYTTDSGTIEEMESQILKTCKIMNETLQWSSSSQLLISWKVNYTTIRKLNSGHHYNKTFDVCKPSILLQVYNETNCDDIQIDYSLKWIFAGTIIGAGFDESLLECMLGSHFTKNAKKLVVNMEFGSTVGVTESFGLFQTRMNFLSERFNADEPNKQTIYHSNPDSVGDDKRQRLLIQYASFWTASDKTQGSMVLPVPSFRKDASATTTQFAIIPKLYKPIRQFRYREEITWSSILLSTSFQQKQIVIMEENVWKLWSSRLNERNLSHMEANMALPIDVVLDYETRSCGEVNSLKKDILNENVTYQRMQLYGGKPSTILFSVNEESQRDEEENKYCSTANVQFIKQLSLKANIGCVFEEETFQTLIESNVTEVVGACQRINGSLYILATTITLEWFKEIREYLFYFENSVRKELHAVNRFRKQILEIEPSAKVYLQFDIVETGRLSLQQPLLKSNTIFCKDLSPTVNQYLEGIFNWAELESFPIIHEINLRYPYDWFGTWFSLMRRLNYPYPDWSLADTEENTTKSISPSFLMQDYIKPIHNWEMDTCIDWTEKRWEIFDSFFHNSKLGTVYYPEGLFKNRTISKFQKITDDEYTTMLQFIFYRFRLVEFVISFDFQYLLPAVGHVMSSENFDFNTQILINYDVDSQSNMTKFVLFLDQLKKSEMYTKKVFKGVHAKLHVDAEKYKSGVVTMTNFQAVSKMVKLAKQSNVSRGIELGSMEICNELIMQFILDPTDENDDLSSSSIDYIICKEKDIKLSDPKSDWESMLNSHLVIKRIIHQFVPHWQVHFRVEMDFDIGLNNATLDRYTNVLALFKTFGIAYDISYLIVDAFDNEFKTTKTGWYGITNYSDLVNPMSYVEKGTVLRGQIMWYPPPQTPNVTETQDSKFLIIGLSVSSAIVLLLLIFSVCFGMRYRKLRHLNQFLSDSEVQEFLNGRVPTSTEPSNVEMELLGNVEHIKFNPEHKLDLSDLTIDIESRLGSGTFGTVFKGQLKDSVAAIKRPNRDCSKNTFKSFLTEAKVHSYIGNHENVVGFLGAYINDIHKGVLYIATELCSGGSLETYLRKKKTITSQVLNQDQHADPESSSPQFYQLNVFAMEIAQGMEYIEGRRVVHGDLSTRNVLLDENLVCKIGDFGLSRKLYEYTKYVKQSQEPLPWKWMAPESLDKMEFTSKSDVWSYGVTLWEIYSLGKVPYGGLNWSAGFANDLQNGLRLEIPDFASANIYTKMMESWNLNPEQRPTFTEMVIFFKSLSEGSYTVLNCTH